MLCPEPPRGGLVAQVSRRARPDSTGLLVVVRAVNEARALDKVSLGVRSARSGQWIPGQPSTATGAFWYRGLDAGWYYLDARQVGFNQVLDSVEVRPGSRDSVVVSLARRVLCLI